MKLLNPNLFCGGPNGCGKAFEFVEGETVEDARAVIKRHREEPGHVGRAQEHQNRLLLEQGLAPENIVDRSPHSPKKPPVVAPVRPSGHSKAFYYVCPHCHGVSDDFNMYEKHSKNCSVRPQRDGVTDE